MYKFLRGFYYFRRSFELWVLFIFEAHYSKASGSWLHRDKRQESL